MLSGHTVTDFWPISVDVIAVQQGEVTKFHGVLLDQRLSWKYHINHVDKRIQDYGNHK